MVEWLGVLESEISGTECWPNQLLKMKVKVTQSCPTLQPHGLYSPWNSPGQNAAVGKPFSSPGDLLNSGFESRSPALQADSLPGKPPGKSKNTVVGSLSLLQQIFLTQESNQGLLHCRRSYQLDTGFGQMTGLSRISGFKLQVGADNGPYPPEC